MFSDQKNIGGLLHEFKPSSGMIFLVQFLTTRQTVGPLPNEHIMSQRLILSYRHLELQNLCIIAESIKPCSSLNVKDIFSPIFGHQEVSGTTCK